MRWSSGLPAARVRTSAGKADRPAPRCPCKTAPPGRWTGDGRSESASCPPEPNPTNRPTRLKAPASQSETSTSTPIFAHSIARGLTGRCRRMSASSLLNRISPAEDATNIPRNMKRHRVQINRQGKDRLPQKEQRHAAEQRDKTANVRASFSADRFRRALLVQAAGAAAAQEQGQEQPPQGRLRGSEPAPAERAAVRVVAALMAGRSWQNPRRGAPARPRRSVA